MHKHLTKQALLSLLALSVAASVSSQERSSALATVPEYSDDPSGWIRVEVAIFADSNEAAMNSEVWEHAPELGYPENRRWLTRYDEIKAFMDQWGESAVTVNTDGSLEVVPQPVIESVVAVLADADALVQPDAPINIDAHPSNDADSRSLGGYEGTDSPMLPAQDVAAPSLSDELERSPTDRTAVTASDGTQVSIDDLFDDALDDEAASVDVLAGGDPMTQVDSEIAASDVDMAAIDAMDIFNAGDLADANAQFGSGNGAFTDNTALPGSDIDWLDGYPVDEESSDRQIMAAEGNPPTLPTPYQALTVDMLKQGLDQLQQQVDRSPVTALAWLQAPNDTGVPVVIDAWHEESDQPLIQGTLALRRGDETTMDVNIWLNTTGGYLPPRYASIKLVPAPERVLVIETPPVEVIEDAPEAVEFIDLRTGLNTDGSASDTDAQNDARQTAEQTSTSYRHSILVSERRDIREGYVRYIDHPTLQVVATWRELSFKEVYEFGEAQRIRRDIDNLTRSLTAKPSADASRPQISEAQPPDTIVP